MYCLFSRLTYVYLTAVTRQCGRSVSHTEGKIRAASFHILPSVYTHKRHHIQYSQRYFLFCIVKNCRGSLHFAWNILKIPLREYREIFSVGYFSLHKLFGPEKVPYTLQKVQIFSNFLRFSISCLIYFRNLSQALLIDSLVSQIRIWKYLRKFEIKIKSSFQGRQVYTSNVPIIC